MPNEGPAPSGGAQGPSPAGRLLAAWRRWTAPSLTVTDLRQRSQARLLASLLLILVPLVSTSVGAMFALQSGEWVGPLGGEPSRLLSLLSLPLLFAAYLLARGPRPQLGAACLVGMAFVLVWALWYIALPDAPGLTMLYYTAIGVLMAIVFFQWRAALEVALANGALLTLVPWIVRSRGATLSATEYFLVVTFHAIFFVVALSLLHLSRRGQESMRQRQEALSASESFRLNLVRSLAHDLGTPMTPINIQLHMMETMTLPPKQQAASMAILRRNIDHVQRLVGDLKDLSLLETDRLRLDRRPVDLNALVAQVAESYQAVAREQSIHFETVGGPSTSVMADASRLRQIVYNLVSNAFKFTPDGGRIIVHVGRTDGQAEVTVQDSGRGLAPDEIDQLFRPFTQVHRPEESRQRGTGLGLYIARALVEAHGGRVWVGSKGIGHGSTFHVVLPIASAPRTGDPSQSSGPGVQLRVPHRP